ncbi:MAG: exo-alpha-sialidase [Clostridia bacterium]|nr:exo-alpha-sialidase [Clostridia bacterium]
MKLSEPFANNVLTDAAEKHSEENRAWQGAPSIARTRGGRLFVSLMSGGIYEPDPRNCAIAVYSDDNGESWSEPLFVIESMPEKRLRTTDPEFWLAPNGALWLIWAEIPYPAGLEMPTYEQLIDMENDSEYHLLENQVKMYASVCENPDGEELVFSAPRFLFDGYLQNRPFVTPGGRWLFPTWLTSPRPFYQFHYSDDQGQTFHTTEPCYARPDGRHYDEPNFYQAKDGRIAALIRQTSTHQMRMWSEDDGMTWSKPEPLLETASQRPCCGTLPSGAVYSVSSIHHRSRNGLRLRISADGSEFEDRLILDDRERVSYPEVVWDEEENLYIVYDRERNNKIRKSRVTGLSEAAKEILFARIPAEAWKTGRITSDTVRARIITKARINELNNRFTEE